MASADKPGIPLITVAMPVYNAGRYLRPALLSVLGQTFSDWELLLIDDGSTDDGFKLISDLVDDRVRILRDGKNKGLAARLNEAADQARGQYFARMDSDDICFPDRFARQVAFLNSDPELDLVATRAIKIDMNDNPVGAFPYALTHSEICARPWQGFYFPHPTWMGRTTWFRKHRYGDPAPYFCEDQDLLTRSFATSKFATLPEVLFAYRVRNKFNPSKQFGTRWALLKAQVRYFRSKREWISVPMAISVFLGRVLLDGYQWLCQTIGLKPRKPKDAEFLSHIPVWNDVKKSLE